MKPLLAVQADLESLPLVNGMYLSPKLDGIRALIIDGVVQSRNMIPIPNLHVQKRFGKPEYNGFDGELIVGAPTAKDVYRVTDSATRSKDGEPDVTFHLFDDFTKPQNTFDARHFDLKARFTMLAGTDSSLALVNQHKVWDMAGITHLEEMYLEMGYEGVMLRRPNGQYKFGRSTVKQAILLKVKRFSDAEAEILGFEELMSNQNEAGKDALGYTERSTHKAGMVPQNTLGALQVRDIVTGVEFNIGSGFTAADRADIWANRHQMRGRLAKYKHFAIGVKEKPRFPVFLGFRDPGDM